MVDTADGDGLFFIDDKCTVGAFVVAEEMLISQADLTVGSTFAFAPGYILRNGSALLLGDGGHNGQHQFALGVEGIKVFLFKVDLHAFFLELADGA